VAVRRRMAISTHCTAITNAFGRSTDVNAELPFRSHRTAMVVRVKCTRSRVDLCLDDGVSVTYFSKPAVWRRVELPKKVDDGIADDTLRNSVPVNTGQLSVIVPLPTLAERKRTMATHAIRCRGASRLSLAGDTLALAQFLRDGAFQAKVGPQLSLHPTWRGSARRKKPTLGCWPGSDRRLCRFLRGLRS